ncbi:putative transposase [Azospirillum oryzae]|uniref:Putative transposase n=1 Tax=Azospirillum oryzae TaxID=286727 RepID=A0A1X7EX17_9PROT|nr:RNA-guided endonuclease TnpB family protein [Azospirillum oryzae]SMF41243.1 putative transposase [Azospirillum oryzae]
MLLLRGYKFRLYADAAQQAQLACFAGVCRFVYNLALEQRRDWWRQFKATTGRQISYASQNRDLTLLRAEVDWIAAAPVDCLQYALRDVERAFSNFFAGRAGYPQTRKRTEQDAIRFPFARSRWTKLNAKWAVVLIPKVGEVKFRLTRDIPGTVKVVTVTRDALGWHVVFTTEIEQPIRPSDKPAIGIDRGVTRTLALSDGTFRDLPKERLNVLERRARKQARALSHKQKGSNRWAAAKRLLARTKARIARSRWHWNHERSREIATRFGFVAMEALNTKAMTASAKCTVERPGRNVRAKAGLNRAILAAGWQQFETFLGYKLAAEGGVLVTVDPCRTSQTCSCCGAIDKESRESQAVFRCVRCGHAMNADHNAAVNILRAGKQPASRSAVGRPLKREPKRAA